MILTALLPLCVLFKNLNQKVKVLLTIILFLSLLPLAPLAYKGLTTFQLMPDNLTKNFLVFVPKYYVTLMPLLLFQSPS